MKQQFSWLFLLTALVFSCGSAEAYNKKMGDPLTGAPDPDTVIRVLERAVQERNFDDYRSVLADSFVYVADLGTVAMYPKIDWDHWGIKEEEGFLKRLFSPVLKAKLNLTEKVNERGMPYDQRARYEITYKLEIEGKVFVAEGTFLLVEADNRWYLWKWEETMPVNKESSGEVFPNSGEVRASLVP